MTTLKARAALIQIILHIMLVFMLLFPPVDLTRKRSIVSITTTSRAKADQNMAEGRVVGMNMKPENIYLIIRFGCALSTFLRNIIFFFLISDLACKKQQPPFLWAGVVDWVSSMRGLVTLEETQRW